MSLEEDSAIRRVNHYSTNQNFFRTIIKLSENPYQSQSSFMREPQSPLSRDLCWEHSIFVVEGYLVENENKLLFTPRKNANHLYDF